jgi:hypothetical protein
VPPLLQPLALPLLGQLTADPNGHGSCGERPKRDEGSVPAADVATVVAAVERPRGEAAGGEAARCVVGQPGRREELAAPAAFDELEKGRMVEEREGQQGRFGVQQKIR